MFRSRANHVRFGLVPDLQSGSGPVPSSDRARSVWAARKGSFVGQTLGYAELVELAPGRKTVHLGIASKGLSSEHKYYFFVP